ncbi:MAG: hypothetical protein ABI861_05455, partial [Panacibacter sp.]
MKKIYTLLLLMFFVSGVFAQQTFYQKTVALKKLPVTWNGGAPYIVKQTTDFGIVYCGLYFDAGTGNNKIFLIKMDSAYAVQ